MIIQLNDRIPKIENDAYIAPTAIIIGNVIIGHKVGIWFQTTIRGDSNKIIIDDNTNVQDGCVLHTDLGYDLKIGKNVTVGHKCMLHGCLISDSCLIGINSTILNGSKIGKNCIIAANTFIGQDKEIPDNSFVLGNPARRLRSTTEEELLYIKKAAEVYLDYISTYRKLVAI